MATIQLSIAIIGGLSKEHIRQRKQTKQMTRKKVKDFWQWPSWTGTTRRDSRRKKNWYALSVSIGWQSNEFVYWTSYLKFLHLNEMSWICFSLSFFPPWLRNSFYVSWSYHAVDACERKGKLSTYASALRAIDGSLGRKTNGRTMVAIIPSTTRNPFSLHNLNTKFRNRNK